MACYCFCSYYGSYCFFRICVATTAAVLRILNLVLSVFSLQYCCKTSLTLTSIICLFSADPAGGDEGDQSFLDGEDDYLVDDGRPGVPIRALYDYEGSEDDELSFKAGKAFIRESFVVAYAFLLFFPVLFNTYM